MRRQVADRGRFGIEERKDVYIKEQRVKSGDNPVAS